MFARWHDASTEIGAVAAALCVAATACIYVAEVVARYFLDAPLNWSGDVSSYLLCACAFLALPKVTRTNGHIAISTFVEMVGAARRARYVRVLAVLAGLVCLATACVVAFEGAALFARNVLTSQATRIPKWPIALLAFIGFLSSALHLLSSPPEAGSAPGEPGL
jgi:TRAP-type C4-dicarboxylate transport system permease small subunit